MTPGQSYPNKPQPTRFRSGAVDTISVEIENHIGSDTQAHEEGLGHQACVCSCDVVEEPHKKVAKRRRKRHDGPHCGRQDHISRPQNTSNIQPHCKLWIRRTDGHHYDTGSIRPWEESLASLVEHRGDVGWDTRDTRCEKLPKWCVRKPITVTFTGFPNGILTPCWY